MKAGAHFVQKRALTHGRTRFLCCTLWTDFDLLGDLSGAIGSAQQMMNDYNRIARPSPKMPKLKDEPIGWQPQPWTKPEDVVQVHQHHRAWFVEALSQPSDAAQTVVITYHGPHPKVAGAMDALPPNSCVTSPFLKPRGAGCHSPKPTRLLQFLRPRWLRPAI